MLGTQRKIPELHTTSWLLTTKEQEEGGAAVEVSVLFFELEGVASDSAEENQLLRYREGPCVYKGS